MVRRLTYLILGRGQILVLGEDELLSPIRGEG
jgi:hypothetical protein